MPLYDYYCPQCRYFEARREAEEVVIPCPTCGEPAKRLPTVPYSKTESGGDFLPGTPMREK